MLATFDRHRFAAEVEKLATGALVARAPGTACRAARLTQSLAEDALRHCVGADKTIACQAGCAHCCILNVSVLRPEALSIVDHLITARSQARLHELEARLSALDQDTRDLDDEERIMVKKRCAFLTSQGSCDIHLFRPLLCRAVTSTDANDCKESLAMVAFGEEIPVMANLLHREIFETAFSGLGKALENCSMDSRSYRLTGAVSALLNEHLQKIQ